MRNKYLSEKKNREIFKCKSRKNSTVLIQRAAIFLFVKQKVSGHMGKHTASQYWLHKDRRSGAPGKSSNVMRHIPMLLTRKRQSGIVQAYQV